MTGVVFGVIAILWIAYLVPWVLSRRETTGALDEETIEQFADSMKLVRRSNDYEPVFLVDSGAEVSTPLTRRAARRDLRRASAIATRRRRIGMIVHLLLVVVGVALPLVVPAIPQIWTLVPVAMLLGWVVLSRLSVVSLNRLLDARRAELHFGGAEDTIVIAEEPVVEHSIGLVHDDQERSIEITDQLGETLGSLWDPIPVTPTTYVSKPLLPRSVRTIDLAAPVSSSELATPAAPRVPDEELTVALDQEDLPRAVGE